MWRITLLTFVLVFVASVGLAARDDHRGQAESYVQQGIQHYEQGDISERPCGFYPCH